MHFQQPPSFILINPQGIFGSIRESDHGKSCLDETCPINPMATGKQNSTDQQLWGLRQLLELGYGGWK